MSPVTWVLFVSVAVGTAAAVLAWRQRPKPGATPLVALLAGQTWWSTAILFRFQAEGFGPKLFWARLEWAGVVIIPVAWLLFALEYTGHDEYAQPRHAALLSVVPVVTVALAMTTGHHGLLLLKPYAADPNGVVQFHEGGAWFWVVAVYTYLLGGLGGVLLLGLITSDAVTFRGQGATLLVGLVVPWVVNALHLGGAFPGVDFDPTPVAFLVSGVTYLGALTQFRLLGTNPAPNKRAHQYALDRMREGAVVVDSNGFVVDANDSCLDMLGRNARDVLGARASDALPGYEQFPDDGTLPGHLTVGEGAGSRRYDVTVTPITNARGVAIGRVITFHDVSQHLRQQQRLEVLNRVLRHNIRTETNIIHGYVDQFADEAGAQIVKDRAMRIEEIGRKGREAIELFEETNREHTPESLAALLDRCVEPVRESYPGVTVVYDPPDAEVAVAGLLRHVLSNVVENAVQHNPGNDPHVWVTVRVEDASVSVEVADDGPGIDAYEIGVLEDGTETPLRHGSGLGLWIIKWGAAIADGEVRFVENDPAGTVVTVDVPRLDDAAAASDDTAA